MNTSMVQSAKFARKAFLVYAVNGVIASLGVALATICDAVVVGNAFGELGLAITSVVLPMYTIYNFISYALGVGGSALVSRAFGLEDQEEGQKCFARSFTLALLVSVLIAVVGTLFLPGLVALLGGGGLGEHCRRYVGMVVMGAPLFVVAPVLSLMLRADGDPKRSTMGIVVSSVVNLVLDIVFIFGFRTGVEGAAWAMVISQACAVAIYLPHFFSRRYTLRLRLAKCSGRETGELLRGGLGTASASAWQFIYLTVFNNLLAAYSGQEGLAVFNVIFNVGMLAYAVFEGVSLSVPSLAGTYLGERDQFSLRHTIGLALKSALACAAVLMALLLTLAGPVVRMFGITDPGLIGSAASAVRLYSLAIPFVCLSYTLSASWQAMGHTGLALITHFLRGCLFVVGAGIPLILLLGGVGITPALLVGEVLGLAVPLLMALRTRKKQGLDSLMLYPPMIHSDVIYEDVLDRDFARLPEIVSAVEEFCMDNQIPMGTAYSIQLTIEELAANIIRFGFQDKKKHYIAFKVAKYEDDIFVRIRDDAGEYDPFSHRAGDGEELDMLGVELVKGKAKDFIYQRRLVFNNLLIIL